MFRTRKSEIENENAVDRREMAFNEKASTKTKTRKSYDPKSSLFYELTVAFVSFRVHFREIRFIIVGGFMRMRWMVDAKKSSINHRRQQFFFVGSISSRFAKTINFMVNSFRYFESINF